MQNTPENIQWLDMALQIQQLYIPIEILPQIIDTILLVEKKKGKVTINDCSDIAIKYKAQRTAIEENPHKEKSKEESIFTGERTSYEIYWKDINDEAKERLKGLYHENIDLSPIAIIDIENDPD